MQFIKQNLFAMLAIGLVLVLCACLVKATRDSRQFQAKLQAAEQRATAAEQLGKQRMDEADAAKASADQLTQQLTVTLAKVDAAVGKLNTVRASTEKARVIYEAVKETPVQLSGDNDADRASVCAELAKAGYPCAGSGSPSGVRPGSPGADSGNRVHQ